jgi:O-antigen biosynthesis protein WbqP
MTLNLKRIFDLLLALLALLFLIVPILIVAVVVKITSPGPVLYWSERVGRNNKIFNMPKFRSMKVGTPIVASHLLVNPESHLTPIGIFLRKSSLDELPQIWCILVGEMSFVGPRPALFNQQDLIVLRTKSNICSLLPGLTGWAQVNGRDNITIFEKVTLDIEYLNRKSVIFDIKILLLTIYKIFSFNTISH